MRRLFYRSQLQWAFNNINTKTILTIKILSKQYQSMLQSSKACLATYCALSLVSFAFSLFWDLDNIIFSGPFSIMLVWLP